MALLNLGEDSWLIEYESCERLHRDIMETLTSREKLSRKSDRYAQLSATVRLRLKQYTNELNQLSDKLDAATMVGAITTAESERRARQVETLRSKNVVVQKLFNEQMTNKEQAERTQLIGEVNDWDTGGSSSMVNPPPHQAYSIDEIKERQKRMLGLQEQGLESLSQVISRQKNIAHSISNEVDLHNEILDDLGGHIDRTDVRIRTETQHIGVVDTKDRTCVYWIVIILLFLSIVIVATI